MVGARALIIAATVIAAGGSVVAGAHADATPWLAGERIDRALLEAQTALLLDEGEGAHERVVTARDAFGTLAPALERVAPAATAEARSALARAGTATSTENEIRIAAARGEIRAALYLGSYLLDGYVRLPLP